MASLKKHVPFANRGRLVARLARVLVAYDDGDIGRYVTRTLIEIKWADATKEDQKRRKATARAMVRLLEDWEVLR